MSASGPCAGWASMASTIISTWPRNCSGRSASPLTGRRSELPLDGWDELEAREAGLLDLLREVGAGDERDPVRLQPEQHRVGRDPRLVQGQPPHVGDRPLVDGVLLPFGLLEVDAVLELDLVDDEVAGLLAAALVVDDRHRQHLLSGHLLGL